MKTKILITGASGFIGTNLLESFREDFEVLNVDFKAPRNAQHVGYWRNVDIVDFPSLQKVVVDFNPDYIVHLAARTDLDGKTLEDYIANTIGVENILKVANELPALKKIIITSSMLVCKAGYMPIIASDLPYVHDVVGDYHGVTYVDYQDAREWARAIKEICKKRNVTNPSVIPKTRVTGRLFLN